MAEPETIRPTQRHRVVAITTPLGEDVLLLRRMTGSEALGRPFELNLSLFSERGELHFDEILGQSLTVRLDLPSGGQRYFNGLVSHFSQRPGEGRYAHYQATLRPWLWFLTRTADCRIYQHKTVPEILREVFARHEFTELDDSALSGTYRTWEYCVQYRETDFNFVSRLMEQEGIYYYFRHAEGRHTLVLCDSISAHDVVEGYATIPYYPPDEQRRREREQIHDWQMTRQVEAGAYELNDFDFTRPRTSLRARSNAPHPHQHASLEVYDYPGEYTQSHDGDAYARLRLEELHAEHERAYGSGNAGGITVGALFTLENFPREDQNREYLILSTDYEVASDEYESLMGLEAGPRDPFTCTLTAMDRRVPFRPPRITPKPLVQGPQTAIVVGPAGEEIHTDQYGRVKVHFHWDRHDDSDENSSCWVRVSHPWAGKSWGAVSIPRIGQEVIIDFLEGDPDQPIITGRVYNGDNMPPYGLPAGAVISGVKSNSTKGGGGYNEYVLDDTKGNELIREHGQYDKDSTIEHDLREHVLHDRFRDVTHDETIEVGNDRSKTIGQDEQTRVARNRTESVGSNETISIGVDRKEDVGKSETISIGTDRTESVGKNETISIGESRTESVGKDESVQIGASRTHSVAKDDTRKVGKNLSESVGDNRSTSVGKDDSLKVGKNLIIDAGDQITIKTGSASITMKKDGTITIKGKDITINGSGAINVKASKNVVVKGQKVLEN